MKAAVITGYGKPPEYQEVDRPEAVDDTELLEVELAGLNPVDLAIASGKFDAGSPPLPYTPGLEAIGRTGDGRRVWSDEARYPSGALASTTAIALGGGIELPDEISSAQAMAFGVAGMAAWLSLDWRGEISAGETVLINGASGTVGQIAVQVARILGAGRVVGAARSQTGREKVAALGADAVVDTGSETLIEDLAEAAGGGFDLVIDGLWGAPAMAAIETMKQRGRLIQVGNSAATHANVMAGRLRGGSIDIRGHRNFWAPRETRVEAFQRMCRLSLDGDLKIDVEVLPLRTVADAWRRQAASPGRKLALRPD